VICQAMGALFSRLIAVALVAAGPVTGMARAEQNDTDIALIRGTAVQGGLLVFQTRPENSVWLDTEPLPLADNGMFAVGFHRDDHDRHIITVKSRKANKRTYELVPAQRSYDIQRIDNLPASMVTPPDEVIARIRNDIDMVRAARSGISRIDDALINGFDWPVWGRVTGIYGSQRILNGQPRQPHYGIDIAAPPGLPVMAAADGRVTLAADLYFTGWTIIIDHGFGLNSTYSHLQEISVKTGDSVNRGQMIGSLGSTGRSTGPHLDWRINWQTKRLDPMLLSGPLLPALPVGRPKNRQNN